ncbi:hypothetical protein PRK78_004999 [Emydomyces testavorans]|uniref:Dolichyl-diphosphooligosaccharide--protein glycosyltransferase subunit 2 n=1 Tax=Emydomyces testavorans TaxID=2070801 RepID=A0AAF0DMJ7_9EURO|nr:hypothetical protein PRK78_004999 [Emydomyces testavorans]
MHFSTVIQFGLLALSALPSSLAAASWGFSDATLSIQQKGAGVGGGLKEKLSDKKPLSKPIPLGQSDTLKLLLTAQEGRTPKKPHQAFLLLRDPASDLDISYALAMKENGKARLELNFKDLPIQFLKSQTPLDANLVIASFGSALGYNNPVFRLSINRDPNEPLPSSEVVRYGKLKEIHHIFKSDPKSPPIIISLVFVVAVIAALPALAGFTLPVFLAVGAVAILSGSRALGEVQERRLAGLR